MRGCGGGGGRRRDSVKDEQHRPDVDIVLHGSRRTVLVGNADLPRRWRVHESFPGQVRAFLLAEYGGADPRPDPMVEGLQPDQFELDCLRLSNLRKRERGPASEPFPAYRSTDLLACEAARPSHRARGWFALGIPIANCPIPPDLPVGTHMGPSLVLYAPSCYSMNEDSKTADHVVASTRLRSASKSLVIQR